jgi:predicted aspartyl protease
VGILTVGNVACSSDSPNSTVTPSTKASASPKSTAVKPGNSTSTAPDTYDDAIAIGEGANTISQSSVSREDWNTVASRWQEAISLLKAVPASSRNYRNAQKKLKEYQTNLAEAKLRSAPPANKPKVGDANPQFFSVPIKERRGGTPVIEVTFNNTRKFEMLFDTGATGTLITLGMAKTLGLRAIGKANVGIADGSIVTLPIALLKSIEVDGRLKRNVRVTVAPQQMEIGLLGQDFFEGYDIQIKADTIEFRRH